MYAYFYICIFYIYICMYFQEFAFGFICLINFFFFLYNSGSTRLLVSTAQQNESAIHTHIHIPSPLRTSFPLRPPQRIKESSCAIHYVLISYLFCTQYPQCIRIYLCLPVPPLSPSPSLLACMLAQSLSHVLLFETKERRPPLEPGRSKERILSWNSQEKCSQVSTLLLVQWDPFQTSDLDNYKTINLCCLGLPNL